jgi:hypothetical protein
VGDAVFDRSIVGREPPNCVATEDGFLLRTLRDDFPFNSRAHDPVVGLSIDFPNPKLPPNPLGLVSGPDAELGNDSLILGLGSAVCCVLCMGGCPRRGSIWPDKCAMSASLCSTLAGPPCMYVPILLLRPDSPGLVGGSKAALYDAIMFLISPHHCFVWCCDPML